MKIVLATGIYPPEIGGPATYVLNLAKAFKERGVTVHVIAYGEESLESRVTSEEVTRVSRKGGPVVRWRRYAKALREHASDADIVYCFSSVSCGAPLWMARLKHPKSVLRLGGDFLWERYTDRGGTKTLTEWYASNPPFKGMMNGLLKQFGYIIFSTKFQEELYEKNYTMLPLHSVIENALPTGVPVQHSAHRPFRLLFLGRFVSFKNLGSLLLAVAQIPEVTLTLAGEGPLESQLRALAADHGITERITFMPSQSGDSKQHLFLDHDLLVLPSYTEISPNTALESRAAGLPVLLTEETGLSHALSDGAQIRLLSAPHDIVNAVREVMDTYEVLADRASAALTPRTWDQVADEHLALFRNLL